MADKKVKKKESHSDFIELLISWLEELGYEQR